MSNHLNSRTAYCTNCQTERSLDGGRYIKSQTGVPRWRCALCEMNVKAHIRQTPNPVIKGSTK